MEQYYLEISLGTLELNYKNGLLSLISWKRIGHVKSNKDFGSTLPLSFSLLSLEAKEIYRQLETYFDRGHPLDQEIWKYLDSGHLTEFQKRVYEETARIPHGETRTYSWVAEKVGKTHATRAVGQALKRNPFSVVVPCHRVVSVQGELCGFMGKSDRSDPELQLKQKLLDVEENYINPVFPFLSKSVQDIWNPRQSPAVIA